MRPLYYILDDEGAPVPVDDILTWGAWFETHDRILAHDRDESAATPIWVSTVFIGLDHNCHDTGPPLLWETMIFKGHQSVYQDRYTTRDAALAGHQRACQMAADLAAGERR